MFRNRELAFLPGLFANRSRRGSKQRWVDGQFVRFRDGVPQQIGGWEQVTISSGSVSGVPRHVRAWRPNSQLGRYAFIGSHSGAFLLDGAKITDISPSDLVAGRRVASLGEGYSAGSYGSEAYGTARTTGTVFLEASQWTSDLYGQLLVACFNFNSTIYTFNVTNSSVTLEELAGAPIGRAVCVSDERHVFVFGADGVPGRVRWSDRENPSEFNVTSTNRAGSYEMQVLSQFQCGHRVRGNVLGWTEDDVVIFFPLNNSLVYGREHLSKDAGVVGPQAVAIATGDAGEMAFWMSRDRFYYFDGFVRELDCELRDYVFDDINLDQRSQFHAAAMSEHREVWFFYCSALSTKIDRCVIFDYQRNAWSKAPLDRTAWFDAGVFANPIAFDTAGTPYWHEKGETANGDDMASYVLSHPIMVGAGDQFAEIDQFWPDMSDDSADCSVTFITRDRPSGPATYHGPYEYVVGGLKIDLSIAAREIQFRIDGGNGFWELGIPVLHMQGGSLR